MARISGGEMVVRQLVKLGVKQVFGLQGGHIDPIFQSCREHGVGVYDTRHEAAAGHMAEGWARVTRQPGVALATAGPGVTNIVTAVANAWVDSTPMLVIGGRYPLGNEDTLSLQELDGAELMRPITKWSRCVTNVRRIPDYVATAFREASTGRPGPVFLEIPVDLVFAREEESRVWFPAAPSPGRCASACDDAVAEAVAMLAEAERPLMMAGRGVWYANAIDDLRRFAESANVPVVANLQSRGALPEGEHPLSFGGFQTLGNPTLRGENAPDVVLVLGSRLGMFTGGRNNSMIPPESKVIQIDVEAGEIGRGRDVELGIVADLGEALRSMTAVASARPMRGRPDWLATVRRAEEAWRGAYARGAAADTYPIHPHWLIQEMGRVLDEDAMVVVDGGDTTAWAQAGFFVRHPAHLHYHGYLGCLGTGLPFAMAAKLAHPGKQVVVLTGDGSMGLNFAEFDTAVRHGLNVVAVVNNDKAWGMIKHEQEIRYGEAGAIASDLGVVRYDLAAAGFGAHGEFVERPEEIAPALRRALASGKPACVNVMTDFDIAPPFYAGMAAGLAAERKATGEETRGREESILPYYGKHET